MLHLVFINALVNTLNQSYKLILKKALNIEKKSLYIM